MRKTITLLLAAMVVMTAFAQKEGPQRQAPKLHSLPAAFEKGAAKTQGINSLPASVMKTSFTADLKRDNAAVDQVNRPRKATTLITTAPEGETKYYNRAGNAYYSSNGTAIADTQEGMLTIVYAANNEVYLLDPVCYLSTGTYVKGTISGNTITVPLPQTVYNSSYGYNLEIAWVNIPAGATSPITLYDGTTLADRETTEATYTIDGNTITLNGSSATHLLGGVWDDDETWYGAGDYNSVYTETQLEDVVTPPAGATPETYYYAGSSYYSSASHSFNSTVQVVKDGNDVYIQGLATGDADRVILPEAWAKGTLNGATLTIPAGQFMGLYGGSPIYLVGYTSGVEDVTFTYDATADSFTLNNIMIVNTLKDNVSYYSYTESGAVISKEAPELPTVVEVPDGLQTEAWAFVAKELSFDDNDEPVYEDVTWEVQVGFDGNDVYVQGINNDYLPEAWIKGVRDGNQVTFATGQYFGAYNYWGTDYDMYFVGYGANGSIADATFTMNAEENKLTSEDWVLINGEKSSLNYYNIYTEPTITKLADVAAMPVTPEVTEVKLTDTSYPKINLNVPTVDVDGNPLVTSKLYYKVYTDVEGEIAEYIVSPEEYEYVTEEMIEIPYKFNDDWDIYPGGDPFYVYGNFADWNRVGVQSIYYGGGERNATEISWFTIKEYAAPQLYVLGDFQGWKPNEGQQMSYDAETSTYTAIINTEAEGCIKFTTQLSETEEWTIDEYLWGAVSEGDFIVVKEQLGADLTLVAQGEAFRLPAGEWTLTANLKEGILVIEGEWPAEAMYVAGSFTNWADGKVAMAQNEDGLYTLEVEMEENAEFKFIDELGHWYGGVTDGNNFIITEEQIVEGTELTLSDPGMNFVMPFAGKYTLTVDRAKLTLVIEANNAVKGDVNGDGIVSGADVTALYGVLLDGKEVAGNADVNGDGNVSGADVTALYNLLLENE